MCTFSLGTDLAAFSHRKTFPNGGGSMIDPSDSTQIFPCAGCSIKSARKLVYQLDGDTLTRKPEETEEEKRLTSSTFSTPKQLSPEEEKRVLFLKNMLAQLLTLADGQPTEEQKSRIKEVEKELEEITGVKMQSRISNTMDKLPGKAEKDKEKEDKQHLPGIDPKEAIHSNALNLESKSGPGIMDFLQQNSVGQLLKNVVSLPKNGAPATK